ncbi:hypothetical protein DFH06DRAFT_1131937 [Mycena polygramma]|nr:hypothetical protein DFH06DRAFT_1131937 [Mycena polygramma]
MLFDFAFLCTTTVLSCVWLRLMLRIGHVIVQVEYPKLYLVTFVDIPLLRSRLLSNWTLEDRSNFQAIWSGQNAVVDGFPADDENLSATGREGCLWVASPRPCYFEVTSKRKPQHGNRPLGGAHASRRVRLTPLCPASTTGAVEISMICSGYPQAPSARHKPHIRSRALVGAAATLYPSPG